MWLKYPYFVSNNTVKVKLQNDFIQKDMKLFLICDIFVFNKNAATINLILAFTIIVKIIEKLFKLLNF
jgi:hypothetical protein